MNRILPSIIGMLLFSPVAMAQTPPDPETLYERIHQSVQKETDTEKAELAAQRFAAGAYYHHIVQTLIKTSDTDPGTMEDFLVEEKDVDNAIKNDIVALCGDKNHLILACTQVREILERLVERTTWTRRLGRVLQTVASGYEGAMYGYPGSPVNIAVRLPSIAGIWRAGGDPFSNPFMETFLRAVALPDKTSTENAVSSLISTMKNTLIREKDNKKDDTEFVAAIWRYRNGVRYVEREEGPCSSAPVFPADPERLYQERRFCDVENELKTIHANIMASAVIDPPKLTHEQVIFPSIVDKKKNILVWIRDNDIGLQWYIPVEPVQTALMHPDYMDCLDGADTRFCADTYDSFLVRGGNYPEPLDASGSRVREPEEGKGLCSHPFARNGYLCRNVQSEACGLIYEDTEKISDDGITDLVLTGCEPERFRDDVLRGVSGTDVCSVGGWKATVAENTVQDTPDWQDDMRPNKCATCAIDIMCADSCNGQEDFALTFPARHEGVIRICVPRPVIEPSGSLEYLVAHEIVHAQQFCRMSELNAMEIGGFFEKDANDDGTMDENERKAAAASCCATERKAYFIQCKMLAMDGILDIAGVSIDQCASAYANGSCASYKKTGVPPEEQYPCTDDGINPKDVSKKINDVLKVEKDKIGLPNNCNALISNPTARIKALYDSIPLSCAPGCQTRYENTIGNNLCYTGQCVEEGNEFQRPNPGRTALASMDQAFPLDSCAAVDPEIAGVVDLPALTGPKLPPYRPGELFLKLDAELCHINGLPSRTPPIICGFEAARRTALPLLSQIESVDSLFGQTGENAYAYFGLQEAANSIGAMTVADMFGIYLRPAARQFADMVDLARQTLSAIGKTPFPQTMCPRIIEDFNLCAPLKR